VRATCSGHAVWAMSCSVCCSKNTLHVLNFVDLVREHARPQRACRRLPVHVCSSNPTQLTGPGHSLQVLGLIVGIFGLLLFLKWQIMSLIWLWAPLIGIGGVAVLLVFTSECGVYASKNCGCLVSLSNLFGLVVGGFELVAAIVRSRRPAAHRALCRDQVMSS